MDFGLKFLVEKMKYQRYFCQKNNGTVLMSGAQQDYPDSIIKSLKKQLVRDF